MLFRSKEIEMRDLEDEDDVSHADSLSIASEKNETETEKVGSKE